jgi:hypothetical protein
MIHNMRLDDKGHTTYMMVMIHNLTWCQLYFLVTIFLEIPKLNYRLVSIRSKPTTSIKCEKRKDKDTTVMRN